MQGTMKKIPGPTGPPDLTRPSRKMTALSYSWTILMQKNSENGNVSTMRITYNGTKLFNMLPIKMKKMEDPNIFKTMTKDWIWENIPSY